MRGRWKTSERETLVTTPVFSVRRDRKEREPSGRPRDFYVLEAVDWVNVIPLTSDDEVVFIELHRHGTGQLSLEIPGGMIDPEDPSPLVAAAREMQEETGYAADALVPLGVVHPNPAIQANRCFSFLARDARLVGPPSPDEGEDIEVVRYPRREVPRLIVEGKITHSLVIACFFWLYQQEGRFLP